MNPINCLTCYITHEKNEIGERKVSFCGSCIDDICSYTTEKRKNKYLPEMENVLKESLYIKNDQECDICENKQIIIFKVNICRACERKYEISYADKFCFQMSFSDEMFIEKLRELFAKYDVEDRNKLVTLLKEVKCVSSCESHETNIQCKNEFHQEFKSFLVALDGDDYYDYILDELEIY